MAPFRDLLKLFAGKPCKPLAAVVCLVIAALSLNAQIYVGGPLTGNTTWADNGQLYIVVENVVVPSGITLTIEPGVSVLFELNTSLQVKGTLVAAGTQADSIHFLPEGESWSGIYFNGSATQFDIEGNYLGGTIISHCRIINSAYSVVLQENAGVLIEHSVLSGASFGLYIKDATGNIIRNCMIGGHDFGIFLASSYRAHENLFRDNIISNNRYVGFFVNNSSGQITHNTITGNRISGNLVGLYLGNDGPADQGFNRVSENIFINNSFGIRLFQDTSAIERNYIINNLTTGIEVIGASHSLIRHNLIAGNGVWGMVVEQQAEHNYIEGNSIENNGNGMAFAAGKNGESLYNTFVFNAVHHNTDTAVMFRSAPQQLFEKNSIYRNKDSASFVNNTSIAVNAMHNWWGTADTNAVNRVISDVFDNPLRGPVNYRPMLEKSDTAAPITAPVLAVRKDDFTGTTVIWPSNPESDLAGYRVHYGAFDGIQYEHSVDVGTDTTTVLYGLSAADTIAVTAYDLHADGDFDRPEGHESAFTIAVPGPWAGPNTEACFNETIYLGSAVAGSYSSLQWSTGGDGQFDDPALLHPVYTPGANDIAGGSVILTLSIVIEGFTVSDELIARILPVPQVNAGADTTVISGTQLLLQNAEAGYYHELKWTTTGDGTFDNETLLWSTYEPGEADIAGGKVLLILTVASECGSSTDTLQVNITLGYTISGKVHAGVGLAPGSFLQLYRQSGAGFTTFRNAMAAEDGSFTFQFLTPGAYCIYAIPPEEQQSRYAPAYYFNEVCWEQAHRLAADANTYDVDISLYPVDYILPAGTGSVSGSCECGSLPPAVCGDVTLLLYDKSMKYLVGWLRPDNTGSFEFGNLPFGDYIIVGEKAGYLKNETPVISLTAEQSSVSGVTVSILPFKITVALPEDFIAEETGTRVFPNPTHDEISISGLDASAMPAITLRSASGQPVNMAGKLMQSGNERVTLSLRHEASGLYILEIMESGKQPEKYKVLKK